MTADTPSSPPDPVRLRERRLALGAVAAIVLVRSLVFVFGSTFSFDADEGVFGLMAKHLVEGRAVPLFMYGQSYILAVEAWMAAPVFLVAGPTIAALKLPLLAVNLATAVLLVGLLERECGLRPLHALVASLFFALPPPGTTAALLSASGGNVEPFLYVLLLWITRRRPLVFGLVAGLGFLHREFTIYGIAAVFAIEAGNALAGERGGWRPLGRGVRIAAEAWLVVQLVRPYASAAGPGSTLSALDRMPVNNIVEVLRRSCVEPTTFGRGLRNLAAHLGQVFGTTRLGVDAFGLDSGARQGVAGLGWLLAGTVVVMSAAALARVEWTAQWWRRCRFALYLVLVGGASVSGYVVARCGTLSPMRYDLLALYGAVGVTAWFLSTERRAPLRAAVLVVVMAWTVVSAASHGRIWIERTTSRSRGSKEMLLRNLDARGIRYATSDYWLAYSLTFLSQERVIVASNDVQRIPGHNALVEAHRDEAIRISRLPCGAGGTEVLPRIYFCPH